jgi:hypothetical protein
VVNYQFRAHRLNDAGTRPCDHRVSVFGPPVRCQNIDDAAIFFVAALRCVRMSEALAIKQTPSEQGIEGGRCHLIAMNPTRLRHVAASSASGRRMRVRKSLISASSRPSSAPMHCADRPGTGDLLGFAGHLARSEDADTSPP